MDTLLTLGFTPSPQTVLKDILRLPPRHTNFTFYKGQKEERCYIKPQKMTIGSPKEVILQQYQRKICQML